MLIAESFLAMARYEHLPIYKTGMDLTIYLEQVVRNFSRYHKYTLGSDLRQQSRELVTADSCARVGGLWGQRSLKGMMFLILPLQTEDDSHPPFHFFDCALRQTPDLFAERFIGYRDQLPQQQVAVTVKCPVSFAKAES